MCAVVDIAEKDIRTRIDRVDATTYSLLSVSKRGETLTPYEQEERDNEAKRRIRIIPTRFLPSIEQAIKTLYR